MSYQEIQENKAKQKNPQNKTSNKKTQQINKPN